MLEKRSLVQNILLAAAVAILLIFCLFPFVQILSTSLKYQFDWGNPSLIPQKINFDAYKELLGFSEKVEVQIPESIKRLLDNPLLPEDKKQQILDKYKSSGDIFPFIRYFINSFLLSAGAAGRKVPRTGRR